jgi:hypothetical protein
MSGRQTQISWCDGCGLRSAALCILGYGLTVREAFQLECERQPRKVVALVYRAGRGGAVESQSGNFECSIWGCLILCRVYMRWLSMLVVGVLGTTFGTWSHGCRFLYHCGSIPSLLLQNAWLLLFDSGGRLAGLVEEFSGSPFVVFMWLVSFCGLRCVIGEGVLGVLMLGWIWPCLYYFSLGFFSS